MDGRTVVRLGDEYHRVGYLVEIVDVDLTYDRVVHERLRIDEERVVPHVEDDAHPGDGRHVVQGHDRPHDAVIVVDVVPDVVRIEERGDRADEIGIAVRRHDALL